jgi:hypothetical protein
MRGSGGGGSGGGASGGRGEYWACKSSCETAHSKCLDTCEGTWEKPKPSSNRLICVRITRAARVHVAGTLPETTGRGVGKHLYRVPPSIRLNEAGVHAAKSCWHVLHAHDT